MMYLYNIVELVLIVSVFILNAIGIKIPYTTIIWIFITHLFQYIVQSAYLKQSKDYLEDILRNDIKNKSKHQEYIFNGWKDNEEKNNS